MYKLKRFHGVNLAGFQSGLGKKTVDIDLGDHLDREVFVVCGNNASGKSTFLSLIHPSPEPTDGRKKFIVEGKEGLLVREYLGDDGTTIVSKCIYKPRSSGGHNKSCFLTLIRADGSEIELNPNGNVTSYEDLIYTYFGVNKDFISFASFSNNVASIVKMTDADRKAVIGSMTPNVRRFEVAYDIVNEKYKNLKNLVRNVSQQILSLRDEASMEADLKRIRKELKGFTDDREDSIKKRARIDGELRQLTGGRDLDKLMDDYNGTRLLAAQYDGEIDTVYKRLMKLYERMGIEPERKGSIAFDGIDSIPSNILHYERRLSSAEANLAGYNGHIERLRKELYRAEKDISETESALYSLDSQDIDDLKRTRKEYDERLASLGYTKEKDRYEGMSYEEAVQCSRVVATCDQMIQSLYDSYGELCAEVFRSMSTGDLDSMLATAERNSERLTATIQTKNAKKDQLYRRLVEKQQYQRIQEKLHLRPADCHIDTCPFIAEALKYRDVVDEISALSEQMREMGIEMENLGSALDLEENRMSLMSDIRPLVQYLSANAGLLSKYLNIVDLKPLYGAVGNGTWKNLFDVMKIKDIAAVLSEKDLYLRITTQMIPEVDHAIEMAKVYGTNRDLLRTQLSRLKRNRDLVREELDMQRMHAAVNNTQRERYEDQLARWREISEAVERYRGLIQAQLETQSSLDSQDETIRKATELRKKSKELKEVIAKLDDLMRERIPVMEALKLDLDALQRLKIQKATIERDFIVIDVLRGIVAPGKGVRKELIAFYLEDIRAIANHLLLNTFGGELYLNEFYIDDKTLEIPYVFKGSECSDIAYASSAQQSTITTALSLAILSKVIDKYGVIALDEVDAPLNPHNKREFINILLDQARYVGINQLIVVTQEISYYLPFSPVIIRFPGAEISSKSVDTIEVA